MKKVKFIFIWGKKLVTEIQLISEIVKISLKNKLINQLN